MPRVTVDTNIYRDAYGFTVRWRDHGRTRQQRFPLDTPPAVLKAFRDRRQVEAQPAPLEKTGSFVRDAVRFLAQRRGRPCFKSDRAHLRHWIHRFARLSRWTVTREHVTTAISEWVRAGYSAKEIRHRVQILRTLFRTLNPEQPTPCDRVQLPKLSKARPVSVSDALIRDVALRLRQQEWDGIRRLRTAKTRARFLVLATTGQRPAQVQRAQPFDVDLERRLWNVRPAKGDAGTTVYLNDEMVMAWQVFIGARAWGRYDGRSFVKTLVRNGWPKGVRPYNLRHSVGLSLSELGVDLGDIQAHMGHTSPNTTRQFYVPTLPARMKSASGKLDGRLGPTHGLARTSGTTATEQNTKMPENPRQSGRAAARRLGAAAPLSKSKSA